jgi:hypothetical protein
MNSPQDGAEHGHVGVDGLLGLVADPRPREVRGDRHRTHEISVALLQRVLDGAAAERLGEFSDGGVEISLDAVQTIEDPLGDGDQGAGLDVIDVPCSHSYPPAARGPSI